MISRDIYVLLALAASVASAPLPSPTSDTVNSLTERVSDNIGSVVHGLQITSSEKRAVEDGESFTIFTPTEEKADPGPEVRDVGEEEHDKREPLNPTNQCVIM